MGFLSVGFLSVGFLPCEVFVIDSSYDCLFSQLNCAMQTGLNLDYTIPWSRVSIADKQREVFLPVQDF